MMMLEEILHQAVEMQASDIHLCPEQNTYRIYFRIAGELTLFHQQTSDNLINRLKMMADLDLSESRRTQEGQFQRLINDDKFFIRVSIICTQSGEKVALRLLKQQKIRQMDELALPQNIYHAVKQALTQDSGLFIVCGATGAGKTTTLYACLDALNTGKKAIFTIEDPVEYEVASYFQCEPQPAIGITPSKLLKSFMRQDPDIILVGELRDEETAQLAIAAALTGHMVFATLHSNSALDTLHRLAAWQVDFFAFSSAIRLILHQKMQFIEGHACPIFSAIEPNWSTELRPINFEALTQQPTYWHFYS